MKSAERTRTGIVVIGLVLGVVVTAGSAAAATRDWTNSLGGNFSGAGNWSGGVPGTADKARFDLSSAGYTVSCRR